MKKTKEPHTDEQRTKGHFRPVWITSALLLFTLALTIMYSRGIETPSFFPGNILVLTLIEINLILLVLLILLLSRNIIKHYLERRQKILGTGLRGKLIASFVGFSSIPTILLLIVASGLLTSSIENWFSIQVERPLDNALKMAQLYYEEEEEKARYYADNLSTILSSKTLLEKDARPILSDFLQIKRLEYRVAGLELIFPKGAQSIYSFDSEIPRMAFPSPSQDLLQRSFSGESVIEKPSTVAGNLIRAMTPIRRSASEPVEAVLMVNVLIPENLVTTMEEVARSSEDYKQLKAFKNPIKESYLLSFAIITLVILFSATWFGFYLAKGITVPLQQLADGTRAIAHGDLSFRIRVKADDELGVVVDSFNKMTEDLQTGKAQLEEVNQSLRYSNIELDQRRTYTETVLQNIGTGIISLDRHGRITTIS